MIPQDPKSKMINNARDHKENRSDINSGKSDYEHRQRRAQNMV